MANGVSILRRAMQWFIAIVNCRGRDSEVCSTFDGLHTQFCQDKTAINI